MGNEIVWAFLLGILCIIVAYYTSVLSWLVPAGWCGIYLFLWRMPPTPSGIRELLLAIALLLALLTSLALLRLRLWNLKARIQKRLTIGKWIWVLFCLIMLVTTLAQTEVMAYLGTLWKDGSLLQKGYHLLLMLFLLFMLFRTGELVLTVIDRVYTKKRTLTLISCKMLVNTGIIPRYYLLGIHNGKSQHYRVTERTHRKLKKADTLTLELKEGLLGGLYATKTPKSTSKKA